MPTRMTWRPGREGPTLYVYPLSQASATAKPGERSPAKTEPTDQQEPATNGPRQRSAA